MTSNIKLNPLEDLIEGINIIANAVKSTLGPKGGYVIIEEPYKRPIVTKDGVTVARAVALNTGVENLGVEVIRQAANETMDKAGDGTTTTLVLAQAIIQEGYKLVKAGINPVAIKRGIEKILPTLVQTIVQQSASIKNSPAKIEQVATISANNDIETGKLIARAYKVATLEGVITVQESNLPETKIIEVTGTQFKRGYLSPYFITDPEKMTVEYNNPNILVYDGKIENAQTFAKVLALSLQSNTQTPLLIIADEISSQVMNLLITNRVRAGFPIVAVEAPRHGLHRKRVLKDIAILTGGKLISEELGDRLQDITVEDFGSCDSIKITDKETSIIGADGDQKEIDARILEIKGEIKQSDNHYLLEQSQSRLGRMVGGVVILQVGAQTKSELREKLDRIDDALKATKAAIMEGVLPGGGKSLVTAAKAFDLEDFKLTHEEKLGAGILLKALHAPIKTIAKNAGVSPDVVANKVSNSTLGYNALTDTYEDMVKAGIIDPTLVVRTALEAAASVAILILMTNCTISFEDKPEKDVPQVLNQH